MAVDQDFCVGRILRRNDSNGHFYFVLSRSGDSLVVVNVSTKHGLNKPPVFVEPNETDPRCLAEASCARFEYATTLSVAHCLSVPKGITVHGMIGPRVIARLQQGLLDSALTQRKVKNALRSAIL